MTVSNTVSPLNLVVLFDCERIAGGKQAVPTVTVTVRESFSPQLFTMLAQNCVVVESAPVLSVAPVPARFVLSGAAPRCQVTVAVVADVNTTVRFAEAPVVIDASAGSVGVVGSR